MFASILQSIAAIGIFLCASSASAAQIPSWNINFINLLTDFSKDSTNEATLNYELGNGRSSYQVDLFNKHCTSTIAGTTVGTTVSVEKDPVDANANLDDLEILLDFDKQTLGGSSIWNSAEEKIELCVRVQLLSVTGDIIKEDQRDIDIAFDFSVDFNFTTQEEEEPVNMQAASLRSVALQLERNKLEVAEEHDINVNGTTMTNAFLAFAATTIGTFVIML
jgi:hypothetical protein